MTRLDRARRAAWCASRTTKTAFVCARSPTRASRRRSRMGSCCAAARSARPRPPGLSGRELRGPHARPALRAGRGRQARDRGAALAAQPAAGRDRDRRLPRTVVLPPRIRLEVRRDGGGARRATDARVWRAAAWRGSTPDAWSRWAAAPCRCATRPRSAALVQQLAQDLELLPGHRVRATGAEAIALAARIAPLPGRDPRRCAPSPSCPRRGSRRACAWPRRTSSSRFESTPRRRRPRAPRRSRARAARLARGRGLRRARGRRAARRCPPTGSPATASASPTCSPRAASAAPCPAARCRISRVCATRSDAPRPPGLESLRALVDGFAALPHAALPADLRAELRPYQRAASTGSASCATAGLGGVLADDMGLGKTLQALCALARAHAGGGADERAASTGARRSRASGPACASALYHGPGRALDPNADVTLTSYAILRLDADVLAAASHWDTVILDEAQTIKNPDSQVARAAYRLRAGFRVALTGTPVENRLEELWSQLHFTNPGLLGGARATSRSARRARSRTGDARGRRAPARAHPPVRAAPPEARGRARAAAAHRGRAARGALGARSARSTTPCAPRRARTSSQLLGAGGSVLAGARGAAAAAPGRLSPGPRARASAAARAPSKLELLLERSRKPSPTGTRRSSSRSGRRCSTCVEPHLSARRHRLHSASTARPAIAARWSARFQAEAGPPVLLLSLKAGGTGLNLTAADHVFLLDPWWNPAVEDQAADRAHRIGQERPVMVYRLVAQRHRRGAHPRAPAAQARARRGGARRRGRRGRDHARRSARAAGREPRFQRTASRQLERSP